MESKISVQADVSVVTKLSRVVSVLPCSLLVLTAQ